MTDLDEQGRPEPPLAADETATLLGFLEYQRATLAWKCSGLDAAGLRATVAASSMTLGGMLKHLAYVEDLWCSRWLHGGPTVGHPACDGSCSIWSRSTRGTTAMPTSSGSRWTGSPASSRRADSPIFTKLALSDAN